MDLFSGSLPQNEVPSTRAIDKQTGVVNFDNIVREYRGMEHVVKTKLMTSTMS